jgi:UDP-glucose:(heptosyl)LPS alpha-1,3-glucosyltransferase
MALKLAFCIFKYFPFGGLQRIMMQCVESARARGHQVTIYTMSWQGEPAPEDINVVVVPKRGLFNHQRARYFAEVVRAQTLHRYDCVIGFNKMPHLDLYYSADPCYSDKVKKKGRWLYPLTPRFRTWFAFEQAVFAPEATTRIFLHAELEKHFFQAHYHTPDARFILLPPGIEQSRRYPEDGRAVREQFRQEYGLIPTQRLILMVGSGFKTKGVDRALIAFASLPKVIQNDCRMMIVGQDHAQPFIRLAKKLNIDDKVTFLGGRDDVPRFLLGADVLLHPAYRENAGMILLEAIISGLPVLVTGICGYACHVERAQAGVMLAEPFAQAQLNAQLAVMLTSPQRLQWHHNGIEYGRTTDLYSQMTAMNNYIEDYSQAKREVGTAHA